MVLLFGLERFQAEGNLIKSFVPGDLLPLSLASSSGSSNGIRDTVRVVKVIDPCNPFCTKPPPAIGIEWVSSKLDHLSIF